MSAHFATAPSSAGQRVPQQDLTVVLVGRCRRCLAWIDLLAEEAVGLLESVGFFLNIPLTMIGLTALAWGNCVRSLPCCHLTGPPTPSG